MKKQILLGLSALLIITNAMSQKLIPFQYQNKSKWDYAKPWGYMNEDRTIIFTPFMYNYSPNIIAGKYIYCAEGIKDITTGKIIIDSANAMNTAVIMGNLCSISNPKKAGYYKTRTIRNILTKKILTTNGELSNIPNYVVVKSDTANFMHNEGVIDENGKQIIPINYNKIEGNGYGFFVAYDYADAYIFNTKGEMQNKVPYNFVEINANRNATKRFTRAQRTIKGTPIIYEYLWLDENGKEINTKFYGPYIESNNRAIDDHPFRTQQTAYIESKPENEFYSSIDFNENTKMKKNVFLNNNGEVVLNTNDFKNINYLNGNLFIITKNDNKKYLSNDKGEEVTDFAWNKIDALFSCNEKSIISCNYDVSVLNFYMYNKKENSAKRIINIGMEDSVKIDKINIAYNKYYIITAKDYKKKQYISLIYDANGKLLLKDETGIYKTDDKNNTLIKYINGDKNESIFLTYLDENLKPYSFITE